MKMHLIALAAAMWAPLTGGAGARAQGLIQVQAIVEACRADFFRLCPDVRPGGGRILECLSAHQRQLSTPCREALAITIAIRSCRFDFHRFCPEVEPRSGRALACLRAHERDLSYECRDAISEKSGRGYGGGQGGPRNDGPGPYGRWRRDEPGGPPGDRPDFRPGMGSGPGPGLGSGRGPGR